MNAITTRHRTSAAPTKKVLVALTIAVLAGHWLALGGRVSLWPGQWFKTRSSMDLLPDTLATDPNAAGSPNPPPEPLAAPMPVSTSTVRWIAPPAPPPPPPPPPKPVVRKPPPPPTLSSPIEAMGEPLIQPLSVEEMMQDIVVSTEPEPVAQPVPEPPVVNEAAEVPPAATAPTAPPAVVPDAPARPAGNGPAVAPGSLPANATLSYDVKGKAKGFDYAAGGTLTWQQTGNAYEARLEISAFLLGSFQYTSTGLITPQGLAPERFVDRRRSKEKTAVFDRTAGVIRYSAKTPDVVIQPGAQDQLSVMLQLAGLLNTREELVEGQVISVPVSNGTDAEVWRFEIGALENLRLPVGEVPARRLIRQPRKPNDKTVEVWLSPDLGRLPVRMRLTEPNGDFMDQMLDDLPDTLVQPVRPAMAPGNSVP